MKQLRLTCKNEFIRCRIHQAHWQWFAHSAYNAGMAAVGDKDIQSAAVLFGASATFCGAVDSPTRQSLDEQKVHLTCKLCSKPNESHITL